ncbi:MAG: ketoacyl-ACP synthase III [Oscillospiraceae bacterium]|nr:ketoacyl-ACP synthase III [Oscillospiraceae bacterium]
MSFRIIGTGSSLPSRVVTNDDLSTFLDTSDEWISQRVGISERRICTTESVAQLAHKAAKAALEMGGITPLELDMIICATISADYLAPSLACTVQQSIGANCPAMDINAACSGFIYALDTAAGFFARGFKKIMVLGAERLSKLIDWNDRSTAVIFGDGAGAMVLEAGDAYLSSKLQAKGNSDVLSIPQPIGHSVYYENEMPQPYIFMNGQETYKFAVNAMCADIIDVVKLAGLELDDISWVIPHQANARIIDTSAKRLGIAPERCLKNIDRTGNTSAASIPILCDELFRSGKLNDGDYIAMSSFGAGLTSAACVVRY